MGTGPQLPEPPRLMEAASCSALLLPSAYLAAMSLHDGPTVFTAGWWQATHAYRDASASLA